MGTSGRGNGLCKGLEGRIWIFMEQMWFAVACWGVGRWSKKPEEQQSLNYAEHSRNAKKLIFYQLGQCPQILGSCSK